jgi:RNA polymerase sigma factor (sigma-70 family)
VGVAPLAKTDTELVQESLAGAREPMGELLRRHWDTAVFLAARVLGSADLARDAAQEAAIAAMTDLTSLRSPERFGSWFCGIALNVSRRWRRQLRAEVTGVAADLAAAEPGPADAAEAADIAGRIRRAIEVLPSGQREAVWLFYLQGLSHREVSAELGVSVGAVKARLHQARATLAPKLTGMLDTTEGTAMATGDDTAWTEVAVTDIRRSEGENPTHVMVLRERSGDRGLPIWIGPAAAATLALAMESVESPRPFTARLAASLVTAAGSRIEEVRVTQLIDCVFYATVVVQGPGGPEEVDARPSDAVNLALAAHVPIRVDDRLFAAVQPEYTTDAVANIPVATADLAAEAQQLLQYPWSGRA